MAKFGVVNIRITKEKPFYEGHMRVFAEHMSEEIRLVQFGKQDTRGGISITLVDQRYCVPSQKFFNSKDEMLGYLVAYNEANGWHGYDEFANYGSESF